MIVPRRDLPPQENSGSTREFYFNFAPTDGKNPA
jgi:hypothetical protein